MEHDRSKCVGKSNENTAGSSCWRMDGMSGKGAIGILMPMICPGWRRPCELKVCVAGSPCRRASTILKTTYGL